MIPSRQHVATHIGTRAPGSYCWHLVAVSVVMALCTVSCGEPLRFAEWVVPVPVTTPIFEYPALAQAERTERVTAAPDLVIGREANDPREVFYAASGLAVDGDGNIYVADTGHHRVQVFDQYGRFVRSLGQEGQGPGEFQRARDVTIAGSHLIVLDTQNYKFSIWTVSGSHYGDRPFGGTPEFYDPAGLPDGTLVALADRRTAEDALKTSLSHWQADGREIRRLVETQVDTEVKLVTRGGTSFGINVPVPLPTVAVAGTNAIYFSVSSEYQVHSFTVSGEMQWALRMVQPAVPLPEEWVAASLRELRKRVPDATRGEIPFPETLPALSGLEVDGHGHIYVFHYVLEEPQREGPRRPQPGREWDIDVYSSAGARLFSGTMPLSSWNAAAGDHVYRVETDPVTEERIVVRYRLGEPF